MTGIRKHVERELAAIDAVGRRALKPLLVKEIRCDRCGAPVYQVVRTSTPYLALRYRQARDPNDNGESLAHFVATGEFVPTPPALRLDRVWLFHLVNGTEDDDPEIPWKLATACPCGQFYERVRTILTRAEKYSTATPTNATRGE